MHFTTDLRRSAGLVAALALASFSGPSGCADQVLDETAAPAGPQLTPQEQELLDQELAGAQGKADGYGLFFYQAEYINLVLAGETPQGDFALVAGTHHQDFPYWNTQAWDNALLMLGGDGYHFTLRERGRRLTIDVDPGADESTGEIRFTGEMVRAADGESVAIELQLPVSVVCFEARQLGKRYNFLDVDEIPGMRWRPCQLRCDDGRVTIGDGQPVPITVANGELEHGITANLKADAFAFSYDYVAVAQAGIDGYAFVDFVSHALSGGSVVGKLIEWYVTRFASETITLARGHADDDNTYGVDRPAQSDPSVVLFENTVDLGLADLRRQLITTTDADGRALYGLREIFEPK